MEQTWRRRRWLVCYRQAGWIGTGGVNRDTYHLVLSEAFVLSYDILFFPKNICSQVNDYI